MLESKGAGLCSFRRLPEAPLGVEPPNLKVEQGGDGEPGHERGHAAPSSAINLAEGERAERARGFWLVGVARACFAYSSA